MMMVILLLTHYCVLFNVWEHGYLSHQTSELTKAMFWMTGIRIPGGTGIFLFFLFLLFISVSYCDHNRLGARSLLSDM
jgi:hypothetical protein